MQCTENGVRFTVEFNVWHARTDEERSAAIQPDKGLLSRVERAALNTVSTEYPATGEQPRHKRKGRR